VFIVLTFFTGKFIMLPHFSFYNNFLAFCRGQAEREFRVEVEAIGNVRHKNLVRLLGYCVEGIQRSDYVFIFSSSILSIASLLCFGHYSIK
jgi:hypothetical protein